jgi:polyphosphate kinase
LINEILAVCLADNCKARELMPDGTYRRLKPEAGQPLVRSQERFLELAAKNAARGVNEAPPEALPTMERPRRMRQRKRAMG